jgi:zinc protease
VAVWHDAGLRSEPDGKSGIAHLTFRLLTAGPLRDSIAATGATSITSSLPDFNGLQSTVPPEALGELLRIEARRMAPRTFTAAEIDAAKRLVRDERRARVDNTPGGRVLEALYATAFPGQAYGRPLLGSESDLAGVTAEDVGRYVRATQGPERSVLTVVGRFDADATLAAIRRSFGALAKGAGAPRGAAPKAAAKGVERRGFARTTGPRLLALGWTGGGAADPDRAALDLVSRILVEGGAARGWRIARDAQVGLVHADVDRRKDASLLAIVTMIAPDADSAAIERRLIDDIERLGREAPSDEELANANSRRAAAPSWRAVP